jgi:hypothetical protein
MIFKWNKKKRVAVRPAQWAPWKSERSSPTQKVMYALAENGIEHCHLRRSGPSDAVPSRSPTHRLHRSPRCWRNVELMLKKRRLIALDPDKFRTTIPCEKTNITLSTLRLNFCLTFERYFAVAETGRSGRSRLSFEAKFVYQKLAIISCTNTKMEG